MLLVGRLLLATAIVGFGILCLVHGDFVHNLEPVGMFLPASTPGYGMLARLNGIALVAAGLAIMANVGTRRVATALAAFLALWIVLLQVPSAFLDPTLLLSPWWVRTFEILAMTGAAVVLAGRASEPAREPWVRTGRLLFGVSLPVFGVLHLVYVDNVASLVPALYPWPLLWAYLTGTANLAAGVAIATGVLSRLAAILVAFMYGAYALTLHIPGQFMEQPEGYQPAGATSMFVAIGFCGAALIVAGSQAGRVASIGPLHERDEG